MDTAGTRFEAVREALADKKNILTVKELCELAGVSRSGYYRWIRAGKARDLRETKDREDFEKILEAYQFRGYAKGVRGIHMRLLRMGIRMNVKKIRRLMRKYIECISRFRWGARRKIWSTENLKLMVQGQFS